jgi:CelD/BcsL family acetyltransferase involved in cellulose biosynthesis
VEWALGADPAGAVDAIWAHLRDRTRWDVLVLRDVARDGPTSSFLEAAAERDHHPVGRWESLRTPYLPLGGAPRERKTSSKFVANLRRRMRRLEERGAVSYRRVDGGAEDVDRFLACFLALEAAGWKGRAGTAILCRPEIEAFFRGLTRDLRGAGKLRISELALDDEPAAMALSVLHRERLFTLRVAYDERHRRLGPGFVLLMAMIERCFELGLRAYEFCGTEEEYERRYATAERGRCRLRLYQPSLVTGPRYLYRRNVRPILRPHSHAAGR